MASRKRALLTAGLFSIFRPLDVIGTLFFSQIHNIKAPARSCFHSAWSYHLGRWAQSNTCQRLQPPSSPAAKLYGLCLSWPLELMQANKESGGMLFYLLEFCKQLILPCPLDEPALIRMPFILQWFLKNRKLNASEQSSSCLLYACKGNMPAGLRSWGKKEMLQAFKAFLHKSSGAWEVLYKWDGRNREWWGITPI